MTSLQPATMFRTHAGDFRCRDCADQAEGPFSKIGAAYVRRFAETSAYFGAPETPVECICGNRVELVQGALVFRRAVAEGRPA